MPDNNTNKPSPPIEKKGAGSPSDAVLPAEARTQLPATSPSAEDYAAAQKRIADLEAQIAEKRGVGPDGTLGTASADASRAPKVRMVMTSGGLLRSEGKGHKVIAEGVPFDADEDEAQRLEGIGTAKRVS